MIVKYTYQRDLNYIVCKLLGWDISVGEGQKLCMAIHNKPILYAALLYKLPIPATRVVVNDKTYTIAELYKFIQIVHGTIEEDDPLRRIALW